MALQRAELFYNGKILWTYILDRDKKEFKNSMVDSSAIFNEMMSVNGVDVAIYFKALKNRIDVSFRSNDKVDVAALAKAFGGGGHKAASGVSISGELEDIKDIVLKKTAELIN